jgi:aerobic carbon-monoxide dehydrogenase large subunit
MKNTFIGQPMERREDLRFLRGRGEYVDDVAMPGLLHAVILRSSVAHGRLISIDASAALKMPGVQAVLTAADLKGGVPIIPMRLQPIPEFKPFVQPVIAHEKVRYVGEPMAVVLASSAALGEDALEAIAVEIDELPAVAGWKTASRNESLLFEEPGTNKSVMFQARKGDADSVFANAPYVRRERMRIGRNYGLTMEPRGLMASWDEAAGKLTVYGAAKVPFFNRRVLSTQLGLPVEQIEMIENDVGGGYGVRGEYYPEDFLIPFAARHVKRPVKWIEDRRENLMAAAHARDNACDIEVACARDGTILAIRGEVHTDMGAYMRTNGAIAARVVGMYINGPYRVPHIKVDSSLWMTNKAPVGTYRGPGRFEATFFLERMIDMMAGDLGIDRVDFRRKNLITAKEQPYPSAHVQPTDGRDEYDSGDYVETLDLALKEFDWPKASALQGKLIDGKYHGFGIACFNESGGAGPKETARIAITPQGTFAVYLGTTSVGQGVETSFAQIAADALEVPIDRIHHVFHGSTAYVSDGYGAYHARGIVMGGSAVVKATENFLKLLGDTAAPRLGCAPADVMLDIDKVTGGGKSLALQEFAGLTAEGAFLNSKHTYSYGAHIAHVAVDAQLGDIEVIEYLVVQDVGRAINPLMIRGQVLGSLVQGLGGTVMEELRYDENGQLLTGSLVDYLLPTASNFPKLRCIVLENYPSPLNPLGVKGAGDGGIYAGGPIANAVANALQSFGVQPRQLPLSPKYIWELVQAGLRERGMTAPGEQTELPPAAE